MPPTANGPASTPNVTHNRPDQIRLSSLFIPLSLSLSLALWEAMRHFLRSERRIVIGCGRAVCRSFNAIVARGEGMFAGFNALLLLLREDL